jgi:uncharacterized damage-inducible protein DinB
MNAAELTGRLHQHRMWVNHNLLAVAETLSPDQLRQTFAIGQGSVWKSLVHLWAAEYVWLETLLGNDSAVAPGDVGGKLPGNQLGDGALQDVAQLRAEWAQLDARWQQYLDQLTEAQLDEVAYRVSTSYGAGKRFGDRQADISIHLCTHQQYTTAQVINMFRQLGVEKLPDVMHIVMARKEAGA